MAQTAYISVYRLECLYTYVASLLEGSTAVKCAQPLKACTSGKVSQKGVSTRVFYMYAVPVVYTVMTLQFFYGRCLPFVPRGIY